MTHSKEIHINGANMSSSVEDTHCVVLYRSDIIEANTAVIVIQSSPQLCIKNSYLQLS